MPNVNPGPVTFEVVEPPATPTTVVATTAEGKKYEVKLALLVQAVVPTGQVNPLDQMPIFNVISQIVTQIKEVKTDG